MSAAAPESVKLSLLCPVYLFKTLYYVVLSTHYKLFMLKKNCAISYICFISSTLRTTYVDMYICRSESPTSFENWNILLFKTYLVEKTYFTVFAWPL